MKKFGVSLSLMAALVARERPQEDPSGCIWKKDLGPADPPILKAVLELPSKWKLKKYHETKKWVEEDAPLYDPDEVILETAGGPPRFLIY